MFESMWPVAAVSFIAYFLFKTVRDNMGSSESQVKDDAAGTLVPDSSPVCPDPSGTPASDSIPTLLKELQCQPEIRKDEETGQVDYIFDYQGGRFVLNSRPRYPYARLNYFSFFEDDSDNAGMLGFLCNQLNNDSIPRATFTPDGNDKVDVHLRVDMFFNGTATNEKRMIQTAIGSIFETRAEFHRLYQQYMQDNEARQQPRKPIGFN